MFEPKLNSIQSQIFASRKVVNQSKSKKNRDYFFNFNIFLTFFKNNIFEGKVGYLEKSKFKILIKWLEIEILKPLENHNEFTYTFSCGYRKALVDILKFIKNLVNNK